MSALDEKKQELKALVTEAIKELYGLSCDFDIIRPRRSGNGDLSATAALVLGGVLKRPPLEIGREIAEKLTLPSGERAEVAGKGFINFFLKPDFLLEALCAHAAPTPPELPELSDPHFFEVYPLVRLSDVLELQGSPPDGSEELRLLTAPEELRLIWAIFGGDKAELRSAALDFYDRIGLGGPPPLAMARYILLGNALEKLIILMKESNKNEN
ncbi:MAG: hypothetical protein J1F63_02080 [Oscillospiraceae bacterium]|nr:hypothetical protein [Oscillospiraceae bacterium]